MLKSRLKKVLNKDEPDNFLVALDIGTEYVKVLISEYEGDEINVIGSGRVRQDAEAMTAGAVADIPRVIESCDKALMEAEEQAGVSPRSTVIGVAGELVKGKVFSITYHREDSSSEMTEGEVEEIMSKVQKMAYESAKEELSWETGSEDVEIKIVNSAIVSMHLDGYKVNNPVGFKGKEFKIRAYNAFAPLVHVGALEKIAAELDLELLTIAAEPSAVSRALLGADSTELDAVLVDIGGGTTDVAVVTEGCIDGTMMFAIGGRSFTRAIAKTMDIDFEKAEAVKVKYSKHPSSYEGSKTQKVKDSIDFTSSLWRQGLAVALSDILGSENIPNRVYFCGGGSSISSLRKSIEIEDWQSGLSIHSKPRHKLISDKEVKGFSFSEDTDKGFNFITAMGLLRVGHDTISLDTSSKIQSKVNELLKV